MTRAEGPATRSAMPPAWIEPALCTPMSRPPSAGEWVFEAKYDGFRALAFLRDGQAHIRTRGTNDWTERFPEIAAAIRQLRARDAILDGEIVQLDPDGVPRFSALQEALRFRRSGDLVYVVFDLLWHDGEDLRPQPLLARKARLAALLRDAPLPLRYAAHVTGDGAVFHEQACAHGLEGTIAKRRDAPYVSGRTRAWIKIKCPREGRFTVIGTLPSLDPQAPFGALLLAAPSTEAAGSDGPLRYAGRVGTGFSDAQRRAILARLTPRARCPLAERPPTADARHARWVEPTCSVRVVYTERTEAGRLRHPVFRGMDPDVASARAHVPALAEPVAVLDVKVRLTHPDRVVFPEAGLTKRALAAYVEAAAERLLAQVAGRPLTLLRCPEGVAGACFYQRHAEGGRHAGLPRGLPGVRVAGHGENRPYLYVEDAVGLVGLVQHGTIELHPWGARADRPDRPDRLVFELDPDPAIARSVLVAAAREVRDRLLAFGLASFVKRTGGTGLHVVAPIARTVDWDEVRGFCRGFARGLAQEAPERWTTDARRAQRVRRIYLDVLRNAPTATAIAAWSPRARPDAPIAAPVAWEALDEAPAVVRLTDAPALLGAPDPWADLRAVRQALARGALRDVVEP